VELGYGLLYLLRPGSLKSVWELGVRNDVVFAVNPYLITMEALLVWSRNVKSSVFRGFAMTRREFVAIVGQIMDHVCRVSSGSSHELKASATFEGEFEKQGQEALQATLVQQRNTSVPVP
jgi:hypothetical protein